MDDDVARPQLVLRHIAQPEAVTAQVDLDDGELFGGQRGETLFAKLLLEPLERGARKDLALEPLRRGTPRARADPQVDTSNARNRPEALLDDRLAEKSGAAGDQDGLAFEGIGDHDGLSLVARLSVIQTRDVHHLRPRGIGPAEVGGRVGPEPIPLAWLAVKRPGAIALRRRQHPPDRVLRDDVDGEGHVARAGP